MTAARQVTDPHRMVSRADLEALVGALAGGHPFGLIRSDDQLRFVCVHCGFLDHNGGSAVVLDRWRWRCHRCRFTGTRWLLERLVLDDADALDALHLLEEER